MVEKIILNPDAIYNIVQAAQILGCGKTKLYDLIKSGALPACKDGKSYVIRGIHLANRFTNAHTSNGELWRVIDGGKSQGEKSCRSLKEKTAKCGGLTSRTPTDSEYANLLGLATKKPRRNCTTNSKRKVGESVS